MTADERAFLERLAYLESRGVRATRTQVDTLADRKQDRARQSCRKQGWATYGGEWPKPQAWRLTDAGRTALK